MLRHCETCTMPTPAARAATRLLDLPLDLLRLQSAVASTTQRSDRVTLTEDWSSDFCPVSAGPDWAIILRACLAIVKIAPPSLRLGPGRKRV